MSIKITQLSKIYGSQKAVDDISFEVKKGEIVGFLGPNGAGKSTTMKIITGYLQASSGTVEINGQSISSNILEVKRAIGYLPEHNPLYLDMYVTEFLAFSGSLYDLHGEFFKNRIAEICNLCGLDSEQHKKIGMLSKGYRQRVGLAQALLHNPDVLILDEPTTGLDPNQLTEIRNLIKQIGKDKTVIFSTHILQEVEAVCSRVVIINQGKIVMDTPIDSFSQKEKSLETVFEEFTT